MSEESSATPEPQQPLLRVVDPDATPDEIAALVAVFAALGGGEETSRPRRPEWNAPHRLVRRSLPHGPDAWRASGLPH